MILTEVEIVFLNEMNYAKHKDTTQKNLNDLSEAYKAIICLNKQIWTYNGV